MRISPLSRLLVPLFRELEQQAVRYCVLRGYAGLPEETRNDVDLAVDPEALEQTDEIITRVCHETGWLVVGRTSQRGLRRINVFHPEHPGGVLPLDLCTEHSVWGMTYADSNVVLDAARDHAGFRVTRPGCEAAVSLLKGLVRHAVVKNRADHRDRLQECVREDAEGFRLCCEALIGKPLCEELIAACQNADWPGVASRASWVRRTLARRTGRGRVFFEAASARLRTKLRSLSRRGGLDFRGGLFVCLLGPDGSGKTTLSRALEERLGPLFDGTEQFHSSVGVLPKLKGIKKVWYRLRGRPVPDSPLKGVAMPGEIAKPLPAVRTATYIVYYGFEYFLYRLIVRRKLRRNRLVIFDRYFYDYYLMRIHLKAPRWLLDLFSRVIAQPDVLFVMLADPEAIHARKPELTPEEIGRQQEVLKSLRLPASVHLDTSISVERSVEAAVAAIEPVLLGPAGWKRRGLLEGSAPKPPGLRSFLSSSYTSEPLKPIGLRVRNALKPWLIRQPQRAMSYRVSTPDGRRYKLLRFGRSIRDRHRAVADRLQQLADLSFVPSLVWQDERHLLVEYVEGESPRVDDAHFARCLGETLAALYRVGFAERHRKEIVDDVLLHAQELVEAGRLPRTAEEHLVDLLESQLPEKIPTATLCGDQTLANFVLDRDGALHLIDPGAFQENLPIDIFFVCGGLYDRIDRDAFHRAYAAAGGIDFPFRHAEALELIQLVRRCALECRVLATTPPLEVRRHRTLRRKIDDQIESLSLLLEG
jgi:hypothetical protein